MKVKTVENALKVILNNHGYESLHYMDVQSSKSQESTDICVRIKLDNELYITFNLGDLKKAV